MVAASTSHDAQGLTRAIWLLLANAGAWLTAREIVAQLQAQGRKLNPTKAQTLIWTMAHRQGMLEVSRRDGDRNLRYAVTYDCEIPSGMRLREALLALELVPAEE